jgi:hypothetical protein
MDGPLAVIVILIIIVKGVCPRLLSLLSLGLGYSHLSNKREVTLTDFEKFPPPRLLKFEKKIIKMLFFSLFSIPSSIMELADMSEHNLHSIR